MIIILKNGKEIVVRCDDFKTTKNGNDLTGYTCEGSGLLFYVRLDDISAILRK
jgi:hypothetical protein